MGKLLLFQEFHISCAFASPLQNLLFIKPFLLDSIIQHVFMLCTSHQLTIITFHHYHQGLWLHCGWFLNSINVCENASLLFCKLDFFNVANSGTLHFKRVLAACCLFVIVYAWVNVDMYYIC